VLDLPLGSTAPTQSHSVMVNLLGVDDKHDFVSSYEQVLAQHPSANVHTYGKAPRAGRKMGHAGAIISGSKGTAQAKMDALREAGVHVCQNPTEAGEKMVEIVRAL
jgi:phosphoribosylaminoimidazole carboxylase (NCAIR synthetase)